MLRAEPEPEQQSDRLSHEDVGRVLRVVNFLRFAAGSATLAATIGSVYEYLALAGVTDMHPARVVLICAAFFGCLFVWEVVSVPKWSSRVRRWSTAFGLLIIVTAAIVLDRWTVRWQRDHPPEMAEIRNEYHELTATVKPLIEKSSTPRVTEGINVKELQAIPGYLKLDFRFPRRPVEQVGYPASLDVFYSNKGSTYAHDSTFNADLYYADFHGNRPTVQHDQQMEDTLKAKIAAMAPSGSSDVAPGDAIWASYDTSVITQKMFEDIQAGTARLYFAGRADWKSNRLADYIWTCVWLQPSTWGGRPGARQPDPKKDEPIWHKC